jgi:RNA polymerase sigma factor (sigma-70 family)
MEVCHMSRVQEMQHKPMPTPRRRRTTKTSRKITLEELASDLDDRVLEPDESEHFPQPNTRIKDVLDFELNDPLSQLLDAENSRLLVQGLQRLSDKERLCLVLTFYDNLPLQRIAELLRIPSELASRLRGRALRHLGSYLRSFQ